MRRTLLFSRAVSPETKYADVVVRRTRSISYAVGLLLLRCLCCGRCPAAGVHPNTNFVRRPRRHRAARASTPAGFPHACAAIVVPSPSPSLRKIPRRPSCQFKELHEVNIAHAPCVHHGHHLLHLQSRKRLLKDRRTSSAPVTFAQSGVLRTHPKCLEEQHHVITGQEAITISVERVESFAHLIL